MILTLKTRVIKKIIFSITEIKFYNIKIENIFLLKFYFTILLFFTSKKFSLDEQKIFISESLIVIFPNFWCIL